MSEQDRKVAIITGGSQGIGAGLVAGYRRRGWAVVANARTIKPAGDPAVLAIEGDLSEPATADRIISGALQAFGRIDTLINNAGLYIAKPFTDYTEEDYNLIMNTNVASLFHMTQQVVPQMKKQHSGHVVSISTTLADQPAAGAPAFMAILSKSPIPAVGKALALEYASDNIRFNTVSPGVVNTPMHAGEDHTALAKFHPLNRIAEISDVVDAVFYLQNATFVTGENIHVDGGFHAGR